MPESKAALKDGQDSKTTDSRDPSPDEDLSSFEEDFSKQARVDDSDSDTDKKTERMAMPPSN